MPNGDTVGAMMDEETRAALNLTKEQLRAMRDAAEPAVVARRPGNVNEISEPGAGASAARADWSSGNSSDVDDLDTAAS